MSWFRREKPLHERLAEEGGLTPRLEPLDAGPRWGEVGIHGVHRPRRWDAVATTEAPALEGDRVEFVALPDGTLLVERGVADDGLAAVAEAVEREVEPPYRGEAVRQSGNVWAVAVRRMEVIELDQEVDGDAIELASSQGERTLHVDGRPVFGSIPALERFARERFADYVLRAERLEDDLWEVAVTPL